MAEITKPEDTIAITLKDGEVLIDSPCD